MKTPNNHKLLSFFVFAPLLSLAILASNSGSAGAIQADYYSQSMPGCTHIQEKITQKTQEFNDKRQRHLDGYSKISGFFTSVITTLDGADYNTDVLKELEVGLNRRIVKFSGTSEDFLGEMADAGQSACRDGESFSLEIEEARQSLKDVQLSVSDLQTYIQKTLVAAIKDTVKEAE